jgi:hypothetical protein
MPSFLLPEPLFRLMLVGSMVVVTIFLLLIVVVFVRELRSGRVW